MLTLAFLVKLYTINTSMSNEVVNFLEDPLPKAIIYLKTLDKKFNAKKESVAMSD